MAENTHSKPPTGNLSKIGVILALIGLVIAFFYFDLKQYLSFEYLKSQRESLNAFYTERPALTSLVYLGVYISLAALSLPGAAIMTLAGGAIFGLLYGTVLVSFASSIGATLAFLVARFLLRESIQKKFAQKLQEINKGIDREGWIYLFTMRLIPAIPFFVINVVMGLTRMKIPTFFLVSQIGMLPGTIVYVNAGTQLGQLESAAGILSPSLILSFVLLGVFPIIVKKVVNFFKKGKGTTASSDI